MSSNHVLNNLHLPNGHNSPYLNDQQDQHLASYGLFQNGHDQAFNQNFNFDPAQLANSHSHQTTPVQQPPQPQPQQQQQHQQPWQIPPTNSTVNATTYDPRSQQYRAFSNGPAPFREGTHVSPYARQPGDASAGASHGLAMPGYSGVSQTNTVSPAALQARNSYVVNPALSYQQRAPNGAQPQAYPAGQNMQLTNQALQSLDFPKPPPGKIAGNFIVLDVNDLSKVASLKKLGAFVDIGQVPHDLLVNKTTIPQYVPRKSRKELRALAASDKSLLAKITKRSTKKAANDPKVKVRIQQKYSSLHKPTSPGASVSLSSETESSDDSSDYDSSDSEEEVSPLPASRPSAPLEAVKYDTIKAVWLSRQNGTQAEKIRKSLTEFFEVVRTIKDRWKADATAVKEAEEKKKIGEIPFLKDRVKTQRDMLEVSLKTALEHGHPEVLRLVGEHVSLVFAIYSFLAERVKEADYTSSFGSIAFDLLLATSTLTTETLEKTKLAKVLQLFGKRGDDKVKAKVKQINQNAVAASKAKAKSSTPAPEQTVASPAKDVKVKVEQSKKPSADAVGNAKRPRVDGDGGPPAKRVVSGTSAVPAKPVQKRPLSSASDKVSASAATATKANVVSKPTTNFFAGLQSASKKPSATAGAQPKAKPNGAAPEKKPVAPATKAFSFSDAMKEVLKPKKEEPKAKLEEKRPEETAEQKAKRLRKEERRKLRVTWKPDHTLCQIRTFVHDPEEEHGHDANMVRDVGDVGGEGRMFKQHKDMEIDEDEDFVPEETYGTWSEPSLVDFSAIDDSVRQINYAPFGGGHLQPASPEKVIQEKHVANTLSVYYSDRASPQEPNEASTSDEEFKPAIELGKPVLTLDRVGQVKLQTQASAPQHNFAPPAAALPQDINAILNMLKTTSQPQASAQHGAMLPSANTAAPADPLSALLAGITPQSAASNPFGIPSAPTPPVAAPPPPVPADLSQLLAQIGAGQPQAQPQQQPALPFAFPPAIPAPGFPPPGNPDPAQAQALLAAFMSQNQQGGQQPFAFPYVPPPQDDQMGNGQNGNKRKHSDEGEPNGHGKKRQWDPNNPPRFTKPCMFFKEGKCRKGSDCTFRHDL